MALAEKDICYAGNVQPLTFLQIYTKSHMLFGLIHPPEDVYFTLFPHYSLD